MRDAADVVVFIERKGEWIAKLGVIEVGGVAKLYATAPPIDAYWRCYLPGLGVTPRPAASIDEAKAKLRQAITDWIDAAQLASAVPGASPIRSFRQAAP